MKTRIYYNGGTENENGGGDQEDAKAEQPATEQTSAEPGKEATEEDGEKAEGAE